MFRQKKDQGSNLEKATIFHVRQNSLDVVDGDCYAETNQLQTRNWATANEIKSISSPSALSIIHFNYNLWMISFGRHKERQHNTDFVLCTVSVMWMFSRGQFKDIDHATRYKCCKKKKSMITCGSQHGSPETWQAKHVHFFEETTSFSW